MQSFIINKDTYSEWKDFVKSNIRDIDLVAFDLETDSVEEIKANVWGIGLAFQEDEAYYLPLRSPTNEPILDEQDVVAFVTELLGQKKILTHNGVYDLSVWYHRYGLDLSANLHADTILMKHALDEEPPFGLKEVAVLELGDWADKAQTHLYASIQANGGTTTKTNLQMFKADTDVLGTYCCWDVMLTFKLYNKFQGRLEKENLLDLFYEEEIMPLYREVTIPMKYKGIPIDVAYFEKLKLEIQDDISKLYAKIYDQIRPLVSEYEERLLDEEFPVKRTGNFPKMYADILNLNITSLAKKALQKLELNPESPNYREQVAFKEWLVNDAPFPGDVRQVQYSLFFNKNPDRTSVFNINSKAQLKWLFFDKLKETPLSTTDTGAPQADDDFLEKVASKYPWVSDLQDLNKLEKIKGTYIEGLLDRQHEGIVYTSFLQFGTTSGRYASRNPNLQNQPRPKGDDSGLSELVLRYNNAIRAGFVAPEGYSFVDSDYSALEPRCVDKNTRVSTGDGDIKYIKDLSVGEYVNVTPGGSYRVAAKWHTYKPTVKILTNKGVLITSPEHKIFSKDRNAWIIADDITVGERLDYSGMIKTDGKPTTLLPLFAPSKVRNKPLGQMTLTTDLSWLMGSFMGDGLSRCAPTRASGIKKTTLGITGYVGICGLAEDGVVDKFTHIMRTYGFDFSISEDKRSKSGRFLSATCTSPEALNLFINTLCVAQQKNPNKKFGSKVDRLPNFLFTSSVEERVAFFAGLIDTDGTTGSRYLNGRDLVISTAIPELANDYVRLLETLGVSASITYTIKNNKHFGCQVRILSGHSSFLVKLGLVKYMACRRKAEQLRDFQTEIKSTELSCTVKIIRKDSTEVEMVDITVDEVQEFTAEGIRVHNCFAHMSGDKNLQDIFHSGTDMYSAIAIRVFDLKGCSAFKKDSNFVGELHKEKRQIIKALALAVTYGAESFRIADLLKIEPEQAQKLIDDYLNAYPNLRNYIEDCHNQAATHGEVRTIFGRVRHLKEAQHLYKQYGPNLLNARWASSRGLKEERRTLKNKLNNSTNFRIQGLAAHIINRAMININRAIKAAGLNGWVCLMVHDQVVVAALDEHAEAIKRIVQDCMENVVTLDVPLVAEPQISKNLKDGH